MAAIAVLEPPELKHAPFHRINRFFSEGPRRPYTKANEPWKRSWRHARAETLGSWYRFPAQPSCRASRNVDVDVI